MAQSIRISAIAAGDIIFVYSEPDCLIDKAKRTVNVIGQRLLALARKAKPIALKQKIPKFSHVMLGVGGGIVIHADGKRVAVDVISEALHLNTNEASHFRIYRRKDISPDIADAIVKSAMRYYNQKYRFSSYFSDRHEGDTTQFCSRLVAFAYRTAGTTLTSLPDNKVLPIDLCQICQSDAWVDITAELIEEPISLEADQVFPSVRIPGHEEMRFSEFLVRSDTMLHESAHLQRKSTDLIYHSTRHALKTEALLARLSGLRFDRSKQIRINPIAVEDQDAAKITRVLGQLKTLMDLSRLPSIELLVSKSRLNTSQDPAGEGQYVGLPSPLAIHEMQIAREALTIYSYLLDAEVGLFTILAHRTQHEKFVSFRSVKDQYANEFCDAVQPVDELSSYENDDDLFAWVEIESDRTFCRTILRNIIASLKVIETLRSAGSTGD